MPDDALVALLDQLKPSVEFLIRSRWLKGVGTPEVTISPSKQKGATNALFAEVEAHVRLFVKYHLEDAKAEKRGYNILRRAGAQSTKSGPVLRNHLVPPLFANTPQPVMLVPFANARTFHDLVIEKNTPPVSPERILGDFLKTCELLWTSTQGRRPRADLNAIYSGRVHSRIADMTRVLGVGPIQPLELVVNGISFGTISDLTRKLDDALGNLQRPPRITIHGDEHPKNLMVWNEAVKPSDWAVIDYVNSRADGDWVFSIAKMLHWWDFYYAIQLAKDGHVAPSKYKASWEIKDGVWSLKYNIDAVQERIPPAAAEFRRLILQAAGRAATACKEPPTEWKKRLELALFSVVFGSVAHHLQRQDDHFAVPIMIGEAVRHLP